MAFNMKNIYIYVFIPTSHIFMVFFPFFIYPSKRDGEREVFSTYNKTPIQMNMHFRSLKKSPT